MSRSQDHPVHASSSCGACRDVTSPRRQKPWKTRACGLWAVPTAHSPHLLYAAPSGQSEEVNTLQRQARLFHLVHQTTTLAEGVEWSDGTAALRWRAPHPSTSTWDGGVQALLEVHATADHTTLHWLTTTPDVRRSSPPPPADPVKTVWLPVSTPDGLCSRCGQLWPCLSCGP